MFIETEAAACCGAVGNDLGFDSEHDLPANNIGLVLH
jgi:hypothetical protein